jgi:TcpE family
MALDLPTYTTLWDLERKMYAVDDIFVSSRGIPYEKLGIYAGIFVPWWGLLHWLGLPFERGLPSVLYLVVPGLATYLLTKARVQGKKPLVWLWSQLRYLFEPHAWHRLTAVYRRMPAAVSVEAVCWQPEPTTAAPRQRRRPRRPPPRHAAAGGALVRAERPPPARRRRSAIVAVLLWLGILERPAPDPLRPPPLPAGPRRSRRSQR